MNKKELKRFTKTYPASYDQVNILLRINWILSFVWIHFISVLISKLIIYFSSKEVNKLYQISLFYIYEFFLITESLSVFINWANIWGYILYNKFIKLLLSLFILKYIWRPPSLSELTSYWISMRGSEASIYVNF